MGAQCSLFVLDDKKNLGDKFQPNILNKYIHSEIIINQKIIIYDYNDNPYDHYEQLDMLGTGTNSKIYKTVNKNNKTNRAIKTYDLSDNQSEKLNNLIKNEIKILKHLDHPNIVKLFEYYQNPKETHLILELLGNDIFDKLSKNQKFSEEQTAKFIVQIISAVKYMHDNGIIYRDIKPENILIYDEENFLVKLIDYDTSLYINEKKLKEKIGTPSYMAPEILKGEEYDYKVDVWSIGILMYFLLMGCLPFQGINEDEIFKSILKDKIDFSNMSSNLISNEAINLMKDLLNKDSYKRININEALNSDFIKKYINNESKKSLIQNISFTKDNLKNFKIKNFIQLIVYTYLIHINYDLNNSIYNNLNKLFIFFDEDNDGLLNKNEFNFFLSYYYNENEVKELSDKFFILFNDENNKNQFITYSNFLLININIGNYLNETNIQNVFNKMDIKKQGKINKEDIKFIFDKENLFKNQEDIFINTINKYGRNIEFPIDYNNYLKYVNEE